MCIDFPGHFLSMTLHKSCRWLESSLAFLVQDFRIPSTWRNLLEASCSGCLVACVSWSKRLGLLESEMWSLRVHRSSQVRSVINPTRYSGGMSLYVLLELSLGPCHRHCFRARLRDSLISRYFNRAILIITLIWTLDYVDILAVVRLCGRLDATLSLIYSSTMAQVCECSRTRCWSELVCHDGQTEAGNYCHSPLSKDSALMSVMSLLRLTNLHAYPKKPLHSLH